MYLLAVFLSVGVVVAMESPLTVEFYPKAVVNPGKIYLGDIAAIQGDSALVSRLRVLEVGNLSKPGRQTRISIQAIKNFYIPAVCQSRRVQLIGEGSVLVESRGASLPRDSIAELLLSKIEERLSGVRGRDWDLDPTRLPVSVPIPAQKTSLQIELAANFDGNGQESATLRVFQGDRMISRHALSFTVRRWASVVVLNRPIQRGQILQNDALVLERVEVTGNRRPFILALRDAEGRVALRTLTRGTILTDDALEKPYAVRTGDPVRLVIRLGNGHVSVGAKARQNGYVGQFIEVENEISRQVVSARIEKAGEVWIAN